MIVNNFIFFFDKKYENWNILFFLVKRLGDKKDILLSEI